MTDLPFANVPDIVGPVGDFIKPIMGFVQGISGGGGEWLIVALMIVIMCLFVIGLVAKEAFFGEWRQ